MTRTWERHRGAGGESNRGHPDDKPVGLDPDGRRPAHATHHGGRHVVHGAVARTTWIAHHRLAL